MVNISQFINVDVEDVENAILKGYADAFKFEYEEGTLTEDEEKLAKELYESRYNRENWVYGRRVI